MLTIAIGPYHQFCRYYLEIFWNGRNFYDVHLANNSIKGNLLLALQISFGVQLSCQVVCLIFTVDSSSPIENLAGYICLHPLLDEFPLMTSRLYTNMLVQQTIIGNIFNDIFCHSCLLLYLDFGIFRLLHLAVSGMGFQSYNGTQDHSQKFFGTFVQVHLIRSANCKTYLFTWLDLPIPPLNILLGYRRWTVHSPYPPKLRVLVDDYGQYGDLNEMSLISLRHLNSWNPVGYLGMRRHSLVEGGMSLWVSLCH